MLIFQATDGKTLERAVRRLRPPAFDFMKDFLLHGVLHFLPLGTDRAHPGDCLECLAGADRMMA